MEQLSTIIQVVGSLITLVILPLLLLRSKNMGHRTKRILRIERKEYQTY